MCEVVAYKGLKTVENSKTINPKKWLQLLTRGSNYRALTGKFCVLDLWLLMGGGHTWRFDCTSMTKFLTNSHKQLLVRQS